MKRLAFIMMALLLALMPAAAQNYRDSRYYNSRTDRLDYRYNYNYSSPYYGFRIGPAFTFVNSDDSRLDGGDWQTGLECGRSSRHPIDRQRPTLSRDRTFVYRERWQEGSSRRQEDDLRPQLS